MNKSGRCASMLSSLEKKGVDKILTDGGESSTTVSSGAVHREGEKLKFYVLDGSLGRICSQGVARGWCAPV
jgi:hypothetical protein